MPFLRFDGLNTLLSPTPAVRSTPNESNHASGYPTGPVISTGADPPWTFGDNTGSTAIISAPDDQDMMITDLSLSVGNNDNGLATLTSSGGTVLGQFYLQNRNSIGNSFSHAFSGGIRIPGGESVTLTATATAYYSLSGYYAHP